MPQTKQLACVKESVIVLTVSLHACRNAGSSLLQRPRAIEQIVRSMSSVLSCPVTIKVKCSAELLCCAVLLDAVMCCAVLCCAALCRAEWLCYAVLSYSVAMLVLCYAVLCCAMLS